MRRARWHHCLKLAPFYKAPEHVDPAGRTEHAGYSDDDEEKEFGDCNEEKRVCTNEWRLFEAIDGPLTLPYANMFDFFWSCLQHMNWPAGQWGLVLRFSREH